MEKKITIKSLNELKDFAFSFAKNLQAGDVIALDGNLGAGKTQLVKYFAEYFKINETLQSPSFPILIEYSSGTLAFYHFDLYRIESKNELRPIGFYDYLNKEGVCFIEWASKFKEELPSYTYFISIIRNEDETREITIL